MPVSLIALIQSYQNIYNLAGKLKFLIQTLAAKIRFLNDADFCNKAFPVRWAHKFNLLTTKSVFLRHQL